MRAPSFLIIPLHLHQLVDAGMITAELKHAYEDLMIESFKQSGGNAHYPPFRISNGELAVLWHLTARGARERIAELKTKGLIERRQIGRYTWKITLLIKPDVPGGSSPPRLWRPREPRGGDMRHDEIARLVTPTMQQTMTDAPRGVDPRRGPVHAASAPGGGHISPPAPAGIGLSGASPSASSEPSTRAPPEGGTASVTLTPQSVTLAAQDLGSSGGGDNNNAPARGKNNNLDVQNLRARVEQIWNWSETLDGIRYFRARCLAKRGFGYLEVEFAAAEQSGLIKPGQITLQAIQAEYEIADAEGINTAILVWRLRELAAGRRRPSLSRAQRQSLDEHLRTEE